MDNPTDSFNPEQFRRSVTVNKTAPPSPARLPQPGKNELYIGGSIPLSWLSCAAALPGKALHASLALWFEASCSRGKKPTVNLPPRTYRRFGLVARSTRERALEALAGAGLISIETRRGRPSLFTILSKNSNP